MAPPAKRKSKRLEKKKKNAGPLRRSERVKIPASSPPSGSKRANESPDRSKTKRKKENKAKSVKQLKMEAVEVNKIRLEDGQANGTQKKRMDVRSYKSLFRKQPKKVDGTEEPNPREEEERQRKGKSAQTFSNQDLCDDLNGTYSGSREDSLEEITETTQERTAVTSTSQSAGESFEKNKHKLIPTSQKDSCKNTSSNEGDPQISKHGLVAGEMNDDSEKTANKNLQSPELVESIVPGEDLDFDISVEMVTKAMPYDRKGHDMDVDSRTLSSNDIGTCTGAGTSFSTGCKRKVCTETCGMCSKRQRVDSNSTEQGICSSNTKLNQLSATSSDDFTSLCKSAASGSDKIHTTSNSLHLDSNISKIPALKMDEWESRRKQRDSQKNLHVLLRPQIAKLCEVLRLTVDVKDMVERFLEYVMNNHLVNKEPESILQAFQISLCWSAASLMKQKLDHKESLALAKQHLGFTCKKEEADYVYSMLRCLKRMFLYRRGYLKVPNPPKDSGLAPEIQLAQRDLQKSIKEIEKKCDKLIGKLIEKHKEEREQFNQKYQEEKAQLENMKRTEAAVISYHSNVSKKTDKLKSLDTKYARKLDELKQQMDLDRKNLEALQVEAKRNILERKARWVESVESWVQVELVKPPVSHQISDGSKGNMSDHKTVSLSEALENLVSMEASSCKEIPNRVSSSMSDREVPLKAAESMGFREGETNLGLLLAPSSEKISGMNTLRKVDEEVPLRETVVANSDGQENLVSTEALSHEEIPDGAALNNFDGEVQLRALEGVPGGTTLNMANGELPLGRPEAIGSTERQGATLDVPCEENPKSTSEVATSCEDIIVCTNSSTSKEPETALGEFLKGGRVERENDGTSPMENDQQDGVLCTEFQEPSLVDSSSVHPVPTLDQGGPPPPDPACKVSPNVDSLAYASNEVQARYTANNEMQNASQVAETSFNDAIDVSNPDATVVELREQMQQLRSSESTSGLSPPDLPSASAVEHQSNIEGQTANQNSQAPGQLGANDIELSNQDVLQPLHSPIDGVVDRLARQASGTRTGLVPSVSNGLPLLTAPTVSSRMPILYNDPLHYEMERLLKEKERAIKVHEDTKVQLKLECEKEIEEIVIQIRSRYQVKLKDKEAEFLLQKKELDVNYNKVLLNKILAEAFRCKCMDKASGSMGEKQDASFMQQLVQLSSQQMVQQPPSASGLPSTGSASSMQTALPAVVNAPTMGPPLQVVNPMAFFSSTPTRPPPHISTISSSTGNLQMGTEIRAPAPHLQPFRPSSSISPSSLPLHSHGRSSQQAYNNHPGASLSLRQPYVNPLAHKQASTTAQPGRIQHDTARGLTALPNSSLASSNVSMGVSDPSGANAKSPAYLLSNVSSRLATFLNKDPQVQQSSRSNSVQQPQVQQSSWSNSAQQSGGATDVVCLSDDD